MAAPYKSVKRYDMTLYKQQFIKIAREEGYGTVQSCIAHNDRKAICLQLQQSLEQISLHATRALYDIKARF